MNPAVEIQKPSLLKFWGSRVISAIAAIAFCAGIQSLGGPLADNEFLYRIIVLSGLYVTLAVSLNLINGITGQFSIGHAAFYQVGAYTAGYLTVRMFSTQQIGEVPWLILMCLVGAAAAAITGLIVGLPSLRLKGDYLAIVTLGFGEIIRIIAINIDEVGGAYGLSIVPKIQSPWLIWALAILCIAVCRNLLKTAHGLPFLAVREDEVASSAMGVSTTKIKVTAFVIGSSFAGAAGALLAHYEAFITPDMFKMEVSFIVLTMVVIGGTGSITGSTVAALALFLLPEWLRGLKEANGDALVVSAPQLLGATLAIIAYIALARRVRDHYHGKPIQKAGFQFGVAAASLVLFFLFKAVFAQIGGLAGHEGWEINSLRMAIFAAVLIVIMLLRPQGVFGHHEFSWAWLKSLFVKKKQEAS
jgi:branched-chain amino acid transport system permease protein